MPTLRQCKGLHTYKNELTLPEGALVVADNVVVDEDNVIQPRRGFGVFGDTLPNEIDRTKQHLVYKDRILRHFEQTLQYDSTGSGTFLSFPGSFGELENGLRIKYNETNGNLYFTTSNGIQKISAKTTSDLSSSGIVRAAGGVKALDLEGKLVFDIAGYLPPESKVAYRLVWGYKDKNNNLVLGSPSARCIVTNTSNDIKTSELTEITISDYTLITASSYFLLYSMENAYVVWFKKASGDEAPRTADTIGKTYIEINISSAANNAECAAFLGNTLAPASEEFDIEVQSNLVLISCKEGGETTHATGTIGGISIATKVTGNIVYGSSARVDLVFTVPTEIQTTDYFYQIYRTAFVELTQGLALADLEPGDEMNLVLESNVTDLDITSGEITVQDIVAETFRASGAYLYTNPTSGQGILQSNERPPVAKDLTLFKNSMLYANTKQAHKLQLNLMSVNDFIEGVSSLHIHTATSFRKYTFVGRPEITTITADTKANTTANSWIELNSARNEHQYYLWFDKGAGVDPEVQYRQPIRIDISSAITAEDVIDKVYDALAEYDEFILTDNGTSIVIENFKNGEADDAIFGTTSPGGAWAISITQDGIGEDPLTNSVLLSSQASVSQALDETARSLVKIINKDALCPVSAYYLSNADTVPGIILLEEKTLADITFYLSVSSPDMTTKFNPEIPANYTITGISTGSGSVNIDVVNSFTTGEKVLIFDTNSTPVLLNEFTITSATGTTLVIPATVTIAGTSGFVCATSTKSDNEISPNRVYYSKLGQVESVPSLNYLDIGPKDKEIKRIISLRDSAFVLKEDGIYIITGAGSSNFSVQLLDNSASVSAPDTAAVLNNQIYCISSQGIITVSETGVSILSRPIENRVLEIANSRFNYKTISFGIASEGDRSYMIWMPSEVTDTYATQCYRYNTFTSNWTRLTIAANSGVINQTNDKIYLGCGDSNCTLQERKNLDRTDFSDIDFQLIMTDNSIIEDEIILSNLERVDVGDVILQQQYVTIAIFNRLLRKLDIDSGLVSHNYEVTLKMNPGDNLTSKMDALNAKIIIDDTTGTVTPKTFSTDFTLIKNMYNLLISELNNHACITTYKDYQTVIDSTYFESLITEVDRVRSRITVVYQMPFLVGYVTIFKGFEITVQWAPQHFGAPELLKQMREGSIIFDQDQFYSAEIAYSTDISTYFEEINISGSGTGTWGLSGVWGDDMWGGTGSDVPGRTLIPREKQRGRYINVRFSHINAREGFRIVGVSAEVRSISTKTNK